MHDLLSKCEALKHQPCCTSWVQKKMESAQSPSNVGHGKGVEGFRILDAEAANIQFWFVFSWSHLESFSHFLSVCVFIGGRTNSHVGSGQRSIYSLSNGNQPAASGNPQKRDSMKWMVCGLSSTFAHPRWLWREDSPNLEELGKVNKLFFQLITKFLAIKTPQKGFAFVYGCSGFSQQGISK